MRWLNFGSLIFAAVLLFGCSQTPKVSAEQVDGALVIAIDDQDVLSYQYETVYPPAGVDSSFQRSGFIHPLKTLEGHTLTRIFPTDHYHHFGIWNPWTKVEFEGDTLDFWNIGRNRTTIRFAEFDWVKPEAPAPAFKVLHEHVLQTDSTLRTALNEWQTISISDIQPDHYLLDLDITYQCATDSAFHILEHRYAGLGWRATEAWNKDNTEVLTSEGKTRNDADGTTGRWIIVQGELGDSYGGMVILSHPANFNHPEPLRVWPDTQEEQGDIFVNFSPTKTRNWFLQPDSSYQLRYRMVVFNGRCTGEQAEAWFEAYTKQ